MTPTQTSPEVIAAETAPLDETEITRLIAAARKETYRPSQTVPQGTADAFRPKSLLELTKQRREADKMAATPATADKGELIEAGPAPLPDAGDAAEQLAVPLEDKAEVLPQEPAPENPDTVLSGSEDSDDFLAGQEAAAPALSAPVELPTNSPPKVNPVALERIRAEAHAAGRAEAEAELRDGLTAATEVLQAAAQALAHPAANALAMLRAEIAEAVLRLASERAGLEIDTMPDAFLERVEALADRIHSLASQPVLRLHPDDLAAIQSVIQASDILASLRIVPSAELLRGDVDLAMDGLRLSDRILGQPAPRKSARAARKPKVDET